MQGRAHYSFACAASLTLRRPSYAFPLDFPYRMTAHLRPNARGSTGWKWLQWFGSLLAAAAVLSAADIKDLQKAYLEGRYDDVIEQSSSMLGAAPNNSDAS